jgi:hypothetical protein
MKIPRKNPIKPIENVFFPIAYTPFISDLPFHNGSVIPPKGFHTPFGGYISAFSDDPVS